MLNPTGGKDAAIGIAARASTYGIAALTQSALAYALGPEGRGAYAVCAAFALALAAAFTLSVDKGAQNFAVNGRLSLSQAVALALAGCAAGCAVGAAIALPLIGTPLLFFQKAAASSFHLALALAALIAATAALRLQLEGKRRFAQAGAFTLLRAAVVLLGVSAALLAPGLGVNWALGALIAGNAAMATVCLWDLRRACGLRFGRAALPPMDGVRAALSYGAKIHLSQLSMQAQPRLGTLLLIIAAAPADIGVFAAASGAMLFIGVISAAADAALYPRIASGAVTSPRRVALYMRLVYAATACAAAAAIAAADPMVRLAFSDAFAPAAALVRVMAPGAVAYAAANIIRAYFNGIGNPETSSLSAAIGLAATLAAFFALSIHFDATTSAAAAVSAGSICAAAFLAAAFRRASGVGLAEAWLPRPSDLGYAYRAARDIVRQRAS